MRPLNNVVLDFETTDNDPQVTMPVQFGISVYGPEGKRYYGATSILNPQQPIHPKAEAVHGISYERAIREGKPLTWFAEQWHTVIWNYQPVRLIGYNLLNFDLIILQHLLSKYKGGRFKYPPIEAVADVMIMCCRHFNTKKWLKLKEAVRRLGIPFREEDFHQADADVKFTWLVFDTLANGRIWQ